MTLRWQYPAPERVASFRVHVGRTPGVYERSIDVGRPRPDAAGVYRAEIELEEGATHYLAVSAVDGSGREGARSNEWARPPRSAPLGTPGKPVVVVP